MHFFFDIYILNLNNMKVSKATVSLQVRSARKDNDGLSPVNVVVCWCGERKSLAAGVKVNASLWDAKKQIVKSKHQNSSVINSKLRSLVSSVESRIEELDASGKPYSASDCLMFDGLSDGSADVVSKAVSGRTLHALGLKYINALGLRKNTVQGHQVSRKKFEELFGADFDLCLLDDGKLKHFASHLSSSMSEGSVRALVSRVSGVYNWAVDSGLLDGCQPIRWHYGRQLKMARRMYCLPEDVVKKMFEWVLDSFGGKDIGYTNKPNAVLCFCSMFILGGIAPIDFASLKAENVTDVEVDGVGYWKVSFRRRKTSQSASIMLAHDELKSRVLFGNYLLTSDDRGGYIFPILTGDGDELVRVNNVMKRLKRKLVEWFKAEGIEIDADKLSFYCARHSFASVYTNQPKASLRGLGTLMGRSVTGLDTYIHQLNGDAELVEASSVISLF